MHPTQENLNNIRQTLTNIKGEIDSNTIIVGDFNTPFKPMDRSLKQKINKETQVLNHTLDETDLFDIFRTIHPMQKNTPSSQVYNEHSPGSTISWVTNQALVILMLHQKIEILSSIFCDHNSMRLDIIHKEKKKKRYETQTHGE